MHKRKRILIYCLGGFLLLYILIWAGINYILIPKVIIPEVMRYLDSAKFGTAKVSIKDITFSPLRGFLLHDLKICDTANEKDTCMLQAEYCDLDLDFLALLRRRVDIKNCAFYKIQVQVSRDRAGKWNFFSLVDENFMKEKKAGPGLSFIIRKFSIMDGAVNFADDFQPDNTFLHTFPDVNVTLKRDRGDIYKIKLSSAAKTKSEESIEAMLAYDSGRGSLEGKARFNTRNLNRYWTYYLDDWLKPWHVSAKQISASMEFTYSSGVFSVQGEYDIAEGVFTFGDLNIRANTRISHTQRITKSDPTQDIVLVRLDMDNVESLSGKYTLLDKGKCTLVITREDVAIERLEGSIKGQPLTLSGKYTFTTPQQLNFKGTLADLATDFSLKLLPDNQGTLDWQFSLGESSIALIAQIQDIKNHVFSSQINAKVHLADLAGVLKMQKKDLGGLVDISGKLLGELDKKETLQADITLNVADFSIFGLSPASFHTDIKTNEGIFAADIPSTPYCEGQLSGRLQFDYDRWGAECKLKDVDVKAFLSDTQALKDLEGTLNGNITWVNSWGKARGLECGGFARLTDTALSSAPLASAAEKGIGTIVKNFVMPVFKKAEGNFQIKEGKIILENSYFHSSTLDLGVTGSYSFKGEADLDLTASILGGGIIKIVRQIIFPISISVDFLTSCIEVHIGGRKPDYKTKVAIKPIAFFKSLLKIFETADPSRYTLEKLW